MRRLVKLTETTDFMQAADDVVDWGYRDLALFEAEFSDWYRFGDDTIFFLNWNEWCLVGEIAFHICRRPGAPSTSDARRLMLAAELTAELGGHYRLLGQEPPGGRGYLRRLGWQRLPDDRQEDGRLPIWYKDLGGAEVVDWDAMSQATEDVRRGTITQARAALGG